MLNTFRAKKIKFLDCHAFSLAVRIGDEKEQQFQNWIFFD